MKGEIYMISTRTIKREKCKFCGKELEQKTMSFIVGDREFVLSGEPVRCDCMKAKIYWKKVDDRRAAIEYKREYNRKMMLRKRYYLNSKMNKRLMEYNFENYMTNNDNRMAYEKSKRYAENFVKGDNKGSLFFPFYRNSYWRTFLFRFLFYGNYYTHLSGRRSKIPF